VIMRTHRAEIPLDTLGKLADRGYRMFGLCLDCAGRYDPKLGFPKTGRANTTSISLRSLPREGASA
jgi:hypothetical protein